MSQRSLWGEIPSETTVRTVRYLLEEQGEILTKATNKVLRGHVTFGKYTAQLRDAGHDFIVRFYIVASLLDSYQYGVMTVYHGVAIYPATVESEALEATGFSGHRRKVRDEEEFLGVVSEILTSETVRSVVAALLAQSGDALALSEDASDGSE